MKNIAVIGAGQLGSRHLQAIVKLKLSLSVYIVDPSESSLATAVERVNQVPFDSALIHVTTVSSVEDLPEDIDVAVVASNANVRFAVASALLKLKKVAHLILEKVLFQRPDEYHEFSRLIAELPVKVWVNCPRRMFPHYRRIKDVLKNEGKINLIYSGGSWGMACNAIHLIDLLSFFKGCAVTNIHTGFLDPEILESKRSGFYEITGELVVDFTDDSRLILLSDADGPKDTFLQIFSKNHRITIHELSGRMMEYSDENNWNGSESVARVLYQSELTNLVVEQLLQTGTCELTPYSESELLHLPFIEKLTVHFENGLGTKLPGCPIT